MKKNIISTAFIATALLMAACMQEHDEGTQTSASLITFNVPSTQWNQATTRAKVFSSINDLKASTTDIRVTAKYHSDHTVYFQNERLQFLNNTWTLSKKINDTWVAANYYWIPNTPLDFFADVVSGNGDRSAFDSQVSNKAEYTFDYTVPAAIANQHDYIYAVSLNQSRNDAGVPLEFKHALSQIVFTASVAENWNVTIEKITIVNVRSAGTFSYETQAWSDLDDPDESYVFTLATPKVFNGMSAAERLLAANDERLVLMPQTLNNPWVPKTTSGDRTPITTANTQLQSYVIVSCKIQDRNDNNYYVGSSATYGNVYAPLSGTWEPNKVYIYDLPFGAGYKADGRKTIEQITLSATIVDWTTGETVDDGIARFD